MVLELWVWILQEPSYFLCQCVRRVIVGPAIDKELVEDLLACPAEPLAALLALDCVDFLYQRVLPLDLQLVVVLEHALERMRPVLVVVAVRREDPQGVGVLYICCDLVHEHGGIVHREARAYDVAAILRWDVHAMYVGIDKSLDITHARKLLGKMLRALLRHEERLKQGATAPHIAVKVFAGVDAVGLCHDVCAVYIGKVIVSTEDRAV